MKYESLSLTIDQRFGLLKGSLRSWRFKVAGRAEALGLKFGEGKGSEAICTARVGTVRES